MNTEELKKIAEEAAMNITMEQDLAEPLSKSQMPPLADSSPSRFILSGSFGR